MQIIRTKKASVRAISILLSLILLIAAVPITASSVWYDKADYNDVKTDDLEAMRLQLKEYDQMLAELKADIKKSEELQASADQTRSLYLMAEAIYNDQLKDLEKTRLYYDNELKVVSKEISAIRVEYDKAYATFLDLLRMSYEEGSANYLEILLGAESFTDLLARIDRVSSLVRYSDNLLQSIDEQKNVLDEKYQKLLNDSEALENAIADQENKIAEIEAWKAENEASLALIDAQIAELTGAKGEYESLSAMLDAEFEAEVNAAIKAENERREQIAIEKEKEEERKRQEALAEAIRRQSYLWPLPLSFDTLSYEYGIRTLTELGYYNKMHYGIDIPAYRGTDIYASKAGKVLIARYHTSYGYYVLLDHGDGYNTLYAHATKLYVKEGEYVDQGAVIAAVGSTGSSTGNHLHFEIRVNGEKVDPMKYLTKP